MAKLNPQQQAFVQEYLVDLNATQAAIRAGYSQKSARSMASQLLTKLNIQEAIAAARIRQQERTQITADRVLLEVARLSFYDPRKFFRDDGSPECGSESDDAFDDRQILGIPQHVAHEALVNLEHTRRQAPQVGQRGVACAEIVEREADAQRPAVFDQR